MDIQYSIQNYTINVKTYMSYFTMPPPSTLTLIGVSTCESTADEILKKAFRSPDCDFLEHS